MNDCALIPGKQFTPTSNPSRSHSIYSGIMTALISKQTDCLEQVCSLLGKNGEQTSGLATVIQSSHPSAGPFQRAAWWNKAGCVYPPTIFPGQLSPTALDHKTLERPHLLHQWPTTCCGIPPFRPRLHLTPSQMSSQGYPSHAAYT